MSSFWTYKSASGRDFLIAQNVRDSAVFLIPLQQILKHGLISHLSLFSTCDQSNLTPAALVGCRVAKSALIPQNWGTFKLLPWVDFPKWVKGLKYCINYIWLKCLYWNILHSTYDKTFMDFYINCSLLMEWPAQLNPSSWVLNISKKRLKTHLFYLHLTL